MLRCACVHRDKFWHGETAALKDKDSCRFP